jgi:MFS family permease
LNVGIYLAGFAAGSVFAGPFSETFGRNIVYLGSMIIFMIFVLASALAPNIGAQLAFRFLAGVFGSTPLTCAGGSISDLWSPLEKTYSFPIFAIGGFAGPALGPVIASYIGVGNIGTWRWTEWITLIMAGLVLIIIFFFQIETYPPLLLKWKAQQLRKLTGDDRFRAELEVTETTLLTRLKTSMARPFLFLQEPIVLFMTLYLTVLYIVLFTFLDGYTYIFSETYGIGQGLSNVIFAAMFVGMTTIAMLVPWVYKKTKKELEQNRTETGTHIDPEVRLWYAMLAAPTIPISLFWMGWTAYVSTFYKCSCSRAN